MVITSIHQRPQTDDTSQILATHLEGGRCVIRHATLRTHAASLSLPVCFSWNSDHEDRRTDGVCVYLRRFIKGSHSSRSLGAFEAGPLVL